MTTTETTRLEVLTTHQKIFETTKEVTVTTKVWFLGNLPFDEKEVTLPKGTRLVVNGFSNYGDAHSMTPVQPRKVFKGEHLKHRFAIVKYSDMKRIA